MQLLNLLKANRFPFLGVRARGRARGNRGPVLPTGHELLVMTGRRPAGKAGTRSRLEGVMEDPGQSGGGLPFCVDIGNESREIPPRTWEENVEGHSETIADR